MVGGNKSRGASSRIDGRLISHFIKQTAMALPMLDCKEAQEMLHSLSAYPFESDASFCMSSRRYLAATPIAAFESTLSDLKAFYYARQVLQRPELFDGLSRCLASVQRCPFAKREAFAFEASTIPEDPRISWSDCSTARVRVVDRPVFGRCSRSSDALVVLTENANSEECSVADRIALGEADIFVPRERCRRICGMAWYLDDDRVAGFFVHNACYAGPTLLLQPR